eukprot:jgi/Psemu1/41965/gm1.41965_g
MSKGIRFLSPAQWATLCMGTIGALALPTSSALSQQHCSLDVCRQAQDFKDHSGAFRSIAVFRNILVDALKYPASDKGLAPAVNAHDVLDTAKCISRPINLVLLEPSANRAKLYLIRTKVEEHYSKLKLPSPSVLDSDDPDELKTAFTALELGLSSVNLQLTTIKLIVGDRNGNHNPSTLMEANSTFANNLTKLKSQPTVLLPKDDHKDKLSHQTHKAILSSLADILEFFKKSCSSQSAGDKLLAIIAKLESSGAKPVTHIAASPKAEDTGVDLQAFVKTLEAQVIFAEGRSKCESFTRKNRYGFPEAALVMKSFRYNIPDIFTKGKNVNTDPMILPAIPSWWISFEGEGSVDGFRYKLQTSLDDMQTCIQDAKAPFTTGLIQWMCGTYQDLQISNPLSNKENWRYIYKYHCVRAIFKHLHKARKVGAKLGVDKLVIKEDERSYLCSDIQYIYPSNL